MLNVSCTAVLNNNSAGVAGGALFIGDSSQTNFTFSRECAAQAAHNNEATFGDPNVF